MGEWKKVVSVRMGYDDLRMVGELREAFNPMWVTFSDVLLGSLRMMHSQVIMPDIMDGLREAFQRLQRTTLYSSSLGGEKPGPVRSAQELTNHRLRA